MAETSPIERAQQTESIQPFSMHLTSYKKISATFLTSGSTISRPGVSSQKAFRRGPTASTSSPHAPQDLPMSASTMLLRLFKNKLACPKFVRNYYCIRISGIRRPFRHHVHRACFPCLLIVEIACSGSGRKYGPRGSQSIDQAGTKYRPDR